jgi:hypothetical protein
VSLNREALASFLLVALIGGLMFFGNSCSAAPVVATLLGSTLDTFIDKTIGPAGFALAIALALAFNLREFI